MKDAKKSYQKKEQNEQKDLLERKEQLDQALEEEYIHLAKVILETTEKHGQRITGLVDSLVVTKQKLERPKRHKHKKEHAEAPAPETEA